MCIRTIWRASLGFRMRFTTKVGRKASYGCWFGFLVLEREGEKLLDRKIRIGYDESRSDTLCTLIIEV